MMFLHSNIWKQYWYHGNENNFQRNDFRAKQSDSGRIKRNGLNSFDVTYFIISYALFQIMDKIYHLIWCKTRIHSEEAILVKWADCFGQSHYLLSTWNSQSTDCGKE